MPLIRTARAFFKMAVSQKDRFRTNDKPSQINFFKWFDSIPFIAEAADTATTTQQGLSKAALDTEAAGYQLNNNADGMTREVLPYQLPDVVAADASITVTSVLYRQTAANEGPNIQGQTRKRFKISANPSALTQAWKEIGAGGNFDDGKVVPGFTTAATSFVNSPLQVRMEASGKIAIRGTAIATNPWSSGDTLFTLPVGYRPTPTLVNILFSSIGRITVGSNGDVVVAGYTGLTDITIPECTFSLD